MRALSMNRTILFLSLISASFTFTNPTITRFFLIRHGRTDWNEQGRIQGHSDIPLNQKGIHQALHVAELLSNEHAIDAVYSSDLQRAFSTAQAISTTCGTHTPITDPQLREAFMGDAEGMYADEYQQKYSDLELQLNSQYPDLHERWKYHVVSNAETKAAILQRIETSLKNMALNHSGQKVVVVTHGGVIKTLIQHYTNQLVSTSNCCIAEFVYDHTNNSLSFVTLQHTNQYSE